MTYLRKRIENIAEKLRMLVRLNFGIRQKIYFRLYKYASAYAV